MEIKYVGSKECDGSAGGLVNAPAGFDEKYIARCLKTLKEWGAPLHGWSCREVIDVRENDDDAPLAECELCGCSSVRYVHKMEHPEFYEFLYVGCICAGVMEGDIIRAKERERLVRNRAKRRKNFIKKKWDEYPNGVRVLMTKGRAVQITKHGNVYWAHYAGLTRTTYKKRPIMNLLTAAYAAFDLIDPIPEVK